VFFPDPRYDLPVFGADIVAGRGVVSAAIVDLSPVAAQLPAAVAGPLAALPKRRFSQERELPEWGTIFSPYVRFVRPADAAEEQQFIAVVVEFLEVLAQASRMAEPQAIDHPDTVKRYQGQLSYCQQQKRNDKTRRVLEKAFNPQWADRYIEELLFDDPVLPG
jgi:phycocyanobilin:ferredoxin oxidoreductase